MQRERRRDHVNYAQPREVAHSIWVTVIPPPPPPRTTIRLGDHGDVPVEVTLEIMNRLSVRESGISPIGAFVVTWRNFRYHVTLGETANW